MRVPCLTALLLLSLGATRAPAAEWVRVETPNFIVYGETGERRIREVAGEFERFREALARVIAGASRPAAVPTVVVVFGSQRSFEPYQPRYNGKPIKLGGYFYSSEDMNIVALVDGNRDDSLRTILHEYVHLVIGNLNPDLPVWLSEGLAEFYSTFQVEDDGRRALVGRVIPSHIRLLNEKRPLPIAELLAVDQSSAAYNEGERQSLFYAQSWALVHMLVSGTSNRSDELAQYARLVTQGTPSLTAWQQVFGAGTFVREIERYVGQDVMKGVLYRFDRDIPKVKSDTSKVSEADTHAALADLLRRVATHEDAEARFQQAVALQPPSARARALYGLLALEAENSRKAQGLLMEATDSPDWLVQYHVATGITRLAVANVDPDETLVAAARKALVPVMSARPDLAHALALAARLDATDDAGLPQALAAIRRARDLAPGREDYVMIEAYILLRREEYASAKQLLTPLVATRYPPRIRESAQRMMRQVVSAEQAAADFLAMLEGRKRRPSAADPAASSSPDASKPDERRVLPAYRRLETGEHRAEGLLERIDCTSSGIVLVLRVADAIEHFASPRMDVVDFISYREDLIGVISCSPRTPPDRVYLTWRSPDDPRALRRVVAVEFLPQPR